MEKTLKNYSTYELCEELEKRLGVETIYVDPYEDYTLNVNGPVVLFVVTD